MSSSMSNAPLVVFLEILDQYSYNADLTCKFRRNISYDSQRKDIVAIFKLGWSNIMDYAAIKRIPEDSKDTICSVTFNRYILPKNITDLYQICYISGRDLQGASTPFLFYAEDNSTAITDSPVIGLNCLDGIEKHHISSIKDQEINKLREENAILRESLRNLLSKETDNTSKNCDNDIKAVIDLVEGLKFMLLDHDKDIKMLKNKIKEGGEEYKKLYLEKFKVQKKYDKLKSAYMDKQPLHEDNQPINDFNLDLGELNSIPPFPSILKHP